MTRFARAKGSKSSNERTPEDSTPWEVMKEQLMQAKKDGEESKKREQAEKQRIENYENFLKEHKTQKRPASWCDFPESQISILSKPNLTSESFKKKKKKHLESELSQSIQGQGETTPQQSTKKSKKKKNKNNASTTDSEAIANDVKEINKNNENKKGTKKHKQNSVYAEDTEQQGNKAPAAGQQENNANKKKKNKKLSFHKEGQTQIAKDNQQNTNNTGNNQKDKPPKERKKRLRDGEVTRRKPVNDNSFQLIINGKEIELVRYDGFPIMKKDAERLQELKNSMIKKGIPKSEVQRTMKLERRRAEKALARVKRDVCYNCRKGGHNLSDCPELKTKIPGVGAPDGLCFKCGSTEHRQFECKVQKDKEFRFATCFICKEPGHIARQCPDNPKGLYPNGGSCNLCGDVTHLRKDCPTVQDQRVDSTIKLQTLNSADLEEIPQKIKSTSMEEQVKKPKKITF